VRSMSEPRPQGRPTPPPPPGEAAPLAGPGGANSPPADGTPSPPAPAPPTDADLFPGAGDPADEAPTIISKTPAGGSNPTPAEGPLGGSLRGRSLAHFELIEPIGVGGMAAVIRARDKQLDRSVALKILPPEMAGDAENVRRFHQEARAAARLDH